MSIINLRKEAVINLTKKLNIHDQKAEIVLMLDYSGSMANLYNDGTIKNIMERVLPISLVLDDDGKVPVYLFSDGVNRCKVDLELSTVSTFVTNNIVGQYRMGGTNYAPFINKIVDDYSGQSTLGRLFGKKSTRKLPTYVIVFTDGDNSDYADARKAFKRAAEYGIFFIIIALGKKSYPFLDQADTMTDRLVDNVSVSKLDSFSHGSDNELYNEVFKEIPGWLNDARRLKLIA